MRVTKTAALGSRLWALGYGGKEEPLGVRDVLPDAEGFLPPL
jgi:hypothetical protein